MKRKIMLILIGFIILWSVFFTVDTIRASQDQKPIFCILTALYDDGGSSRYSGLFYQVYHIKKYVVNDETGHDELVDKGYYVTFWSYSIDELWEDIQNE